jgi:hypothetical protein
MNSRNLTIRILWALVIFRGQWSEKGRLPASRGDKPNPLQIEGIGVKLAEEDRSLVISRHEFTIMGESVT